MMHTQFFKSFAAYLLLVFMGALFAMQTGCTDGLVFQKINDPSVDLRSDDDCELYLVGQVINARTLAAIENAVIKIEDEEASSDSDGMYRIAIKHPLDLIEKTRVMSVRKNGYLMDTYQFVPSDWVDTTTCTGAVSYVCVDFVMTPRHNPIVVQPGSDTKVQIRDTSLFLTDLIGEGLNYDTIISVLDLFIPAGSVDQPTPIWLTSYARSSYAGALAPGSSMKLPLLRFRISSDPLIDLKLPFVVSFNSDHPVPYTPNDPLDVFRYDDASNPYIYYDLNTNVWKNVQDANVGFHQPTQTIQVRSKKLGSYLVTNKSYSITVNEQVSLGDEISVVKLSNCDCGEAKYIKYKVTFDGNFQFGLQGSNLNSPFDKLIYMNDWKIMTNFPFSSLVTLQSGSGPAQYNQFIPGPSKTFEDFALLQKCEQLFFSYKNILQEATGSQYGSQYGFLRPIGVQYYTTSFVCPTSSACHQGCPK
ncbi:MAG: hypothetical protein K9I85_15995 [Saprospiraceae bacterium]|nr:hypothetical protein [Saprospiraceae bacterium]